MWGEVGVGRGGKKSWSPSDGHGVTITFLLLLHTHTHTHTHTPSQNNAHNCNTDAATVAKALGTVMKLWPDSLLVSPATSGNGIEWYDSFFGNCTELYGKGGCKIKYLATHCYSCTPSSTMKYLKEL